MKGWLLNLAYLLGLVLTTPLWLTRMIRHGRYRRDWGRRLGKAPISYGLQPTIWIHGVSVGEVNAARGLLAELHSQLPDYRVVFSTTTDTGLAAAERAYAPGHKVFRWPMDFTFAVRRAIRRVRPSLVVLIEGDVWPNFVGECRRRGVPVVVVNGRIGPQKGYPRYRLIRPLAANLFNSLTAIGVQHEAYADLFRALGVHNEKLRLTGMIKFDTVDTDEDVPGRDELAAALGLDGSTPLLVAGGTGPGEEEQVLAAFRRVREGAGRPVRLAIIPRKPERFDKVAGLISGDGFNLICRSEHPDSARAEPSDAVILGDTMGELRKFYALAYGAFVGRSLVPMGGSDMIEAAAMGRPTCFGPYTFNFPRAESLVAGGGARRVADADELAGVWLEWLAEPAKAAEMGKEGRRYVRSQQGATRRSVEMICGILGREPAVEPGAIATDVVDAAEVEAAGRRK
jgi:3-deoxy-D-manno-octulosonic-acid transferase